MDGKRVASPLRYPGGKTRAVKILLEIVQRHQWMIGEEANPVEVLSPFLGGGSFELALLQQYPDSIIHANDLFAPLHAFWTAIGDDAPGTVAEVRSRMPVDKEAFSRMRYRLGEGEDAAAAGILNKAAEYYIVNRCSFSGATFCGGFSSAASTQRLNDSALSRLLDCGQLLRRAIDAGRWTCSHMDAVDFLEARIDLDPARTQKSFIFLDPPYHISNYIYGKNGDLHQAFDHERLHRFLMGLPAARCPWLLCYNDCPYIRRLYADCQIEVVSWAYGMNATKKSSEILIYPRAFATEAGETDS